MLDPEELKDLPQEEMGLQAKGQASPPRHVVGHSHPVEYSPVRVSRAFGGHVLERAFGRCPEFWTLALLQPPLSQASGHEKSGLLHSHAEPAMRTTIPSGY